jgi:hypothetical protein
MLTWTREVHPSKQPSPIDNTEFGIFNSFKEQHSRKHSSDKHLTEHGIEILFAEISPKKPCGKTVNLDFKSK